VSRLRQLRERAQPACEPFFWARLYGRRLSLPVTWLVLKTPLSANAVSVISVAGGVVGGACFALNTRGGDVAAVLLLLASWVLDCVDGEVARARGTCSLDGEFIDACRHQIVCPAIFGGITLGVYARHPDSVWLLALGLGSTVLSTRFVGGMIDQMVLVGVRRTLRRSEPPGSGREERPAGEGGVLGRVRRWITPLFVDFNIMHVLFAVVVLDALGAAVLPGGWLLLDGVHVAYGFAFPIVKLGSMALAWKRGVSGRVADVLAGRGDDAPHH
jgi:phosphatidylglycerophosphate synthase